MSAVDLPQAAMPAQHQKALQKLLANVGFASVQSIRLGALSSVQKDGKFWLKLPGRLEQFEAKMTGVYANSETDYTWTGELADSAGSITLVSQKGQTRGHFAIHQDQYEIFPTGDGLHALVELNVKKLVGTNCPGGVKASLLPVATPKSKNAGARQDACSTSPDQRVRVLALFTAGALAADPNVAQTIQLAIAQTNQAFQNSQIGGAIVDAVGIRQFNLSSESTTDPRANLNQLIDSSQTLRIRAQADLVILVTGNYTGNAGGVANVSNTFPVVSNEFEAVIGVGAATSVFGFAHELGHLFGARHQQCANLSETGCDDTPGYNHDFAYVGSGGFFGSQERPRATILISAPNSPYFGFLGDASYYVPVLLYSNPDVQNEHHAAGTYDNNNNSRRIGEKFLTVATFNQSSILASSIQGPSSLNPSSTYTWEAIYRCGSGPYSFRWEISSNGFNYSTLGTNEFLTSTAGFMYVNSSMTLRLTVTSTDNQTAISYKSLSRSGGGRMGVEEKADKPYLHDVLPNPVTGQAAIGYSLPTSASVRLDVVNLTGTVVSSLANGVEEAGSHTRQFESAGLPVGIYLYRLQVGNKVETKRLLIVR